MMELLNKFEFKSFFYNPIPLLLEINRFLERHENEILLKINDAETFKKKLSDIFAKYMKSNSDIPFYLNDKKWLILE